MFYSLLMYEMKNTVDNTPEVKKESNWDFKRLRNAAIISMISVLGLLGYNECSKYQFSDKITNGVHEGKEGSNSVDFSYEFSFYRWNGADRGLYDFNVRANENNGIYSCTIRLKDENSFSYDQPQEFKANSKAELKDAIWEFTTKSLIQRPNNFDKYEAERCIDEALERLP